MAESTLIVEGWDDRAFFESLINRFFNRKPEELGIDIRVGDSRQQAKDMLRLYVRQGFTRISIALDINSGSPQKVENEIRHDLASEVKSAVKREKGFVLAGRSRVLVIPMGLHDDEELKSLGITRYALEDYLVKLALQESPKKPDKRLRRLIKEMYHLETSKEFLQPLKAPFRFSDNDRAFARFLIGRTDKAIVADTTSNVLGKLRTLLEGA